jgi:hypothetical protein
MSSPVSTRLDLCRGTARTQGLLIIDTARPSLMRSPSVSEVWA